MSSNAYIIDPPIQASTAMTSFTINIMELVLFTSVKVQAIMRNNDNIIIKTPIFLLTGADYDAWSNDDTYIVDYVKARLN